MINASHVVLLIAVALAIAVIAGYLIIIGVILKNVFSRLITILGAVDSVTEKTTGIGPVIDEINRDLAAGQEALEGAVLRLRERAAPAASYDEGPAAPPMGAGAATAQQPWPTYPIRGDAS